MPPRRTANLRHELKAVAKEAIWLATNHHTPGDRPDIALFCTRRGGSTWLMELLAVNPGIKSLDQPLETTTGTLTAAQFRRMPKFHLGEIVHLDPVTEPMLRRYLDEVLSGALPVNAPIRVWRRDFHLRTDRLLLKIVGAKTIAPWIDDHYDVDVVHLLRNPIAQALSCLRNGWTLTTPAYLDSAWFVTHHLHDDDGWCRDIQARGASLDSFVLNWGLENLVMLRTGPERPSWTVVRYEDLVIEPLPVLEQLSSRLGLPALDTMRERLSTASVSSRLSSAGTRRAMSGGDRAVLADGWRQHVDDDDLHRCRAILERLEIDAYDLARA